MTDKRNLVVTERGPGETWFLNIDKFNDPADIEISEEIGRAILRLQSMDFTTIKCGICLDHEWVCEKHPTKPWAGVVGDTLGCEPNCAGPGVLCHHGQQPFPGLQCCVIGCDLEADVVIIGNLNAGFDNDTYSCFAHVGDLLGTPDYLDGENTSWDVSVVPDEEKQRWRVEEGRSR
jgi:hypothetical protein